MFWYVSGYSLMNGIEKHKDIIGKAKRHAFKAGASINLDLNNDHGYIIISGEIRCDFTTKSNQSLGLISLLSGECFGGLRSDSGSNVILLSIKDTHLIELSFDEMFEIAKSSDSVQLPFYKGILRKKVIVPISPDTLVFKPPRVRLEEALKILADRIGEHRKSYIFIRIRPTSGRLAKMLGLGRLHTILTIAEFYNEHKLVPDIRALTLPL
jgi:CRP-like cAMP-binding protein